MLEKLATRDIQDITKLFSLVNKCARATEGHAWHTPPAPETGKVGKPNAGSAAQRSGNNNSKQVSGNNQPLASAPTAAAATIVVSGGRGPRNDKCPHQMSSCDDSGAWFPMHNSTCHNIGKCQEIKKHVE
jgi:hypothetical protein